jgi:hypothetical protein
VLPHPADLRDLPQKEGAEAMASYLADGHAVRAKTAQLRELRLAKEAADKVVKNKPVEKTKKRSTWFGCSRSQLVATGSGWESVLGRIEPTAGPVVGALSSAFRSRLSTALGLQNKLPWTVSTTAGESRQFPSIPNLVWKR